MHQISRGVRNGRRAGGGESTQVRSNDNEECENCNRGAHRDCSPIHLCFRAEQRSFTGTVKDSEGGVIPERRCSFEQATALRQVTIPTRKGTLYFHSFRGHLHHHSEAKGFKKSESKDVILSVATRVSLGDMVLEVGSITDTITWKPMAGRSRFRRTRASVPTS